MKNIWPVRVIGAGYNNASMRSRGNIIYTYVRAGYVFSFFAVFAVERERDRVRIVCNTVGAGNARLYCKNK